MTYEIDSAFEWLATWHSYLDACPICQNLNGYPFNGIGDIPLLLLHPQWGPVWDIDAKQSLVHPHLNPRGKCRCTVELHVRIDFSKIPWAKEFSEAFDIDYIGPEMFEVTDIRQFRAETDKIRSNFGQIRSDWNEIEYILYRVSGVLSRAGVPGMNTFQDIMLGTRMLSHGALYAERGRNLLNEGKRLRGLENLAFSATTFAGIGLTTFFELQRYGQETWQNAYESMSRERQQALELQQMEIRRRRY